MSDKKQTVIINEIGDMGLGLYPIQEQYDPEKENPKKKNEKED